MSSPHLKTMNTSNAITPPSTPASPRSSMNGFASLNSSSPLQSRISENLASSRPAQQYSTDKANMSGPAELLTFSHQRAEYEFETNSKGKRMKLGEGLWSDVYLAKPCLPKLAEQPYSIKAGAAGMTPPMTPTDSKDFDSRAAQFPIIPPRYAIKAPASTSAKKVLVAEAKILSHLSRLPDADCHIVPFFGLDTRTGALVLEAMQSTLEGWIQSDLNSLDEARRAEKLAAVFPGIAMKLIDSLTWMHKNRCIHADIKPSNILVSNSSSALPHILFSDFSSTVLATPFEDIETPTVGAGTWDYLDPSLLGSLSPASPSQATDLWSLAITLLFLVIGSSPYETFKANKYQQREMIKSGSPLQCLGHGDEGLRNMKRLERLSADLGWNVQRWFARVLVKTMYKRIGVEEWRRELEKVVL